MKERTNPGVTSGSDERERGDEEKMTSEKMTSEKMASKSRRGSAHHRTRVATVPLSRKQGAEIEMDETIDRLEDANWEQEETIRLLLTENNVMKAYADLEEKLNRSQQRTTNNAQLYDRLLVAEREKTVIEARAAELLTVEVGNNTVLLQKAEEANLMAKRDKASFMAALHEVRNPLNGIVLSLEYIGESLTSEMTPSLLAEFENISICATHQEMLLKNIMDLDKQITGDLELPKETFNPAELCRKAVAMHSHSGVNGVRIHATVSDGADTGEFFGAPTQLNLVLVNLLSNAAKFTTVGSIELTVNIIETQLDFKVVRFSVTDTGPGVPQHMQGKIFAVRGQAGDDESRAKGYGFGLFVAHELVERMGGELRLTSPLTDRVDGTAGSEFAFEIRIGTVKEEGKKGKRPLQRMSSGLRSRVQKKLMSLRLLSGGRQHLADESTHLASPPGDVPRAPTYKFTHSIRTDMHGLRVLLVDDSDLNNKLLQRKFTSGIFKPLNWLVQTATTGEEALVLIEERVNNERFDIVVFDQHMGPLGKLLGTEASTRVRSTDPTVLLVGCTGNCTDSDIQASSLSGQDLFWRKPAPASRDALGQLTGAMMGRRRKGRPEVELGEESLRGGEVQEVRMAEAAT